MMSRDCTALVVFARKRRPHQAGVVLHERMTCLINEEVFSEGLLRAHMAVTNLGLQAPG